MSALDTPNGDRAQKALRESERRMRAILETSVEGIITIDERGIVESLNPAASRIFGYTPDEVIGNNVSMLMPAPYRENHDSYIENYVGTGRAKIIGIGREVSGRRKDGTTFPMDLSVCEVRLGERRLFTGFVRDVSERRKLEQAAAAAAEEERARIAGELHDGLGQQLGGLLFMMTGLQRDLRSANSPQAEAAGELVRELQTAITHARDLSHELYAVPPQPDGLAQALEDLADRAGAAGIACAFNGKTSVRVHSQTAASHLYRIAQEAVQNARKHSRATRIVIELIERPASLELKVRDNGIGFPARRNSTGLGLHTMQQRAKWIGGQLLCQSSPGGGSEVVCQVPKAMLGDPGNPPNSA